MPEPFRLEPKMGPAAYKTYRIDRPADVTEKAACSQVGCVAYAKGWRTVVDEGTDLGKRQADYIRTASGRDFRESRTEGLTVFTFPAYQRCFADHRTRPEVYTVRLGDWRGTFGPTRTHARPGDWVEDFGEHQTGLVEQQKKG